MSTSLRDWGAHSSEHSARSRKRPTRQYPPSAEGRPPSSHWRLLDVDSESADTPTTGSDKVHVCTGRRVGGDGTSTRKEGLSRGTQTQKGSHLSGRHVGRPGRRSHWDSDQESWGVRYDQFPVGEGERHASVSSPDSTREDEGGGGRVGKSSTPDLRRRGGN